MRDTYPIRPAFGGGQATPEEAALVAAIRDRLLEHGPATDDDLATDPRLRRLAAAVDGFDAPLSAADTGEVISDMIEMIDTGFEWLVDGRHFLPDEVVRDTVVTVRLTEESAATGDLFDGPDLALLAMLGHDELPLADGGAATRSRPSLEDISGPESLRFLLPPDALPEDATAGRLLALRWDGEALSLAVVDDPPAAGDAPAAIRAAFDHLGDHRLPNEDFLEGHDLVGVARIDHGLFDAPLPPLTELAAAAGLEVRGHRIAEAGFDWEAQDERRQVRSAAENIGRQHGLDADGGLVLLQALEAAHRELAALLPDDAAWPGPDQHRWPSDGGDRPPVNDEQLTWFVSELRELRLGEALAVEAGYDNPWLAPGLRALAERIVARARGRDRAIGHHLLAVAAEVTGDVEEAVKQARLAVRAAPEHGPAQLLASRFASLRGRAAEALQHLTAVYDLPPGDTVGDLLRTHAQPGPADAPRNAPCPCGSGRKHKVCCGPRDGWPLAERTGWLLLKAREHATGPFHAAELGELIEVIAGVEHGTATDRAIETLAGSAFVQGLLLWEGGVLEEFLDAYAPLLPADELELGRRWLGAQLELWEVTEVRPGEGLGLTGLYRGESVDVRERTWSHQAHVGQTVLARVLDGIDHLELQAVWPVELRLREHLLTEMFPHDPDHFAWAAVLAPRPMRLANRDGDELVMHTTTYAIDVDTDTVVAALQSMGFEADDDGTWAWIRPDDPDRLVRGFLHLDEDDGLVVATNSDRRRTELDDGLREVFGDAIEEVDHETETIEQARARMDAEGGPWSPTSPTSPDDLPPEARAALEEMVRDAERRWVDEPVPALGGLTPRAALDDPTRRGDLLALLEEFDRDDFGPAVGGFDTDNLRRHLGLL